MKRFGGHVRQVRGRENTENFQNAIHTFPNQPTPLHEGRLVSAPGLDAFKYVLFYPANSFGFHDVTFEHQHDGPGLAMMGMPCPGLADLGLGRPTPRGPPGPGWASPSWAWSGHPGPGQASPGGARWGWEWAGGASNGAKNEQKT